MTDSTTFWLPFEPLDQAVRAAGGLAALGAGRNRDGVATLRANFYRCRAAGRISRFMADELAVKLVHRHPSEVWGSMWTAPVTETCTAH